MVNMQGRLTSFVTHMFSFQKYSLQFLYRWAIVSKKQ